MTKPYWYDKGLGVIYIGDIKGESLLKKTFYTILRGSIAPKAPLASLYGDFGEWLRKFHGTLASGQTVGLDEIFRRLHANLADSPFLTPKEKGGIRKELTSLQETGHADFELVRTHNDFSLRNILVSGYDFGVIDWDAMVHPQMPNLAPAWYDISFFFINLQSLVRFHPAISKKKLHMMTSAFLKGYFPNRSPEDKTINELLYLFTLRHFLGIDTDRPLPMIYRSNLGSRYAKWLKDKLVSEPPSSYGIL